MRRSWIAGPFVLVVGSAIGCGSAPAPPPADPNPAPAAGVSADSPLAAPIARKKSRTKEATRPRVVDPLQSAPLNSRSPRPDT